MDKEKIKWCCKQKKGIELVELKPHLSESYLKEAEEDFKEIEKTGAKWKMIVSYYSCYGAFYSLLMKCGIKCEIHDCSLELMEMFRFDENEIEFIKSLKEGRKDNQYYLKRKEVDENKVREFISRCNEITEELNSEKIENIRNEIKEVIGE